MLRQAINAHYLIPHLPKGCAQNTFDGVVFHLRDMVYSWEHREAYVQPPCEMYIDVMKRGGFQKARAIGRGFHPCYAWLEAYNTQHSDVQIDLFTNRSFQEDICEIIGAKN